MKPRIDPTKKRSYQEFLYILPFIILVAIFSYFPLYGWVYAFHDYQPPKPIGPETFAYRPSRRCRTSSAGCSCSPSRSTCSAPTAR